MLTKPAKWNIISLGSLFSIWAKKCFELWLKNMCTSRICSNELCIILQMKQFWLLLGQIEKIGLLLFRHLVPLPIYRPIFVHVYSVDSLSLSQSLCQCHLSLSVSLNHFILYSSFSFPIWPQFPFAIFCSSFAWHNFHNKSSRLKMSTFVNSNFFSEKQSRRFPGIDTASRNIIFARKINEKGSSTTSKSTTTI